MPAWVAHVGEKKKPSAAATTIMLTVQKFQVNFNFTYKVAGKSTELTCKVNSYALVLKEDQAVFQTLQQAVMICREVIPEQVKKTEITVQRPEAPSSTTGARDAAPPMFKHLYT